ncbi:MAG TPA: hypothetical protein DCZ69_10155, partial [Syntrophobacteraceae bacterium]|nr:hypothetical protein [Syntrophobacteraceae bacterium]
MRNIYRRVGGNRRILQIVEWKPFPGKVKVLEVRFAGREFTEIGCSDGDARKTGIGKGVQGSGPPQILKPFGIMRLAGFPLAGSGAESVQKFEGVP